MKSYVKILHKMLWCIGFCTVGIPSVKAQQVLPENALPMILTADAQTVSPRERHMVWNVTSNVPFEIQSDSADWLHVEQHADGKVFFHIAQNYYNTSRSAKFSFVNAENNLVRKCMVTQRPDDSVNELPTDQRVLPFSASDNNHQPGQDISKTSDNDMNTPYHSEWGDANPVTPENPAILTYNFRNVSHIDYIDYVPSGGNGNFGNVEVYVKQRGDKDFRLYEKYDWKGSYSPSTVKFNGGLDNPVSIRFKVLSGLNNFASCKEMKFMQLAEMPSGDGLFTDEVFSQLKAGVTKADIEKASHPFVKSLAYQLLDGKYDTDYRVADYPCFLSYMTLSELWNVPGKYYDQIEGVTGINVPAHSKTAVIVSGIPLGIDVQLKVIAWYVGKIGGNFDGGDPHTSAFSLRNGINVIDYDFDYDGLAYICYYANENPEKYADIKVHFVNGEVNGYLSPDKTNAQMHEICKNAKNRCIDIYGKKVHQIWEPAALYKYCKATDGKIGYHQFMNVADSLITWEHRSLGFEKYNRIPKNHTMAYVNYTYYMFQGGFGVSFHMDQQSRLMNCKNLIYQDNDAIWGLSHEWGHQHQMHPHFTWSGMSEVSNNMQSYYNVMKMGFRECGHISGWPSARDCYLRDKGYEHGDKISAPRENAYKIRDKYKYSPKMYALCESMKGGVIAAAATNKLKAVAYNEIDVNKTLCPLIMLHNYFTTHGLPDFMPDWYEALRQSDNAEGSVIEKQSGIDKYEILACCQNWNKNGRLKDLREKYPNSCWVKDNYIDEQHCGRDDNAVPYIMNFCRKVSRLSGYNLLPYFEQWGYLRQVAMEIGDYGNKYYVMTPEMYNEFASDMEELVRNGEIKEMPDGMVEDISNSPDWFQKRPVIDN